MSADPTRIAGIAIPDSALAREATEFVSGANAARAFARKEIIMSSASDGVPIPAGPERNIGGKRTP